MSWKITTVEKNEKSTINGTIIYEEDVWSVLYNKHIYPISKESFCLKNIDIVYFYDDVKNRWVTVCNAQINDTDSYRNYYKPFKPKLNVICSLSNGEVTIIEVKHKVNTNPKIEVSQD